MLNESYQTTEEQEKALKFISNIKDKNEKLSFVRKQKKIEMMVAEMEPLDDQLLRLQAERQSIIDKIVTLRKQMVKECIHPKNSLVHKDTYIECKFCNARLSIPRIMP